MLLVNTSDLSQSFNSGLLSLEDGNLNDDDITDNSSAAGRSAAENNNRDQSNNNQNLNAAANNDRDQFNNNQNSNNRERSREHHRGSTIVPVICWSTSPWGHLGKVEIPLNIAIARTLSYELERKLRELGDSGFESIILTSFNGRRAATENELADMLAQLELNLELQFPSTYLEPGNHRTIFWF